MTRFADPWALLLLCVPVCVLAFRYTRRAPALRVGSVQYAQSTGKGLRQRVAWLPTVMPLLAMMLLSVAIARPQAGRGETHTSVDGLALMVVMDRSGSMTQSMTGRKGSPTRLDVVKETLREFVLGDGNTLPGRTNDLVGLVAFAGWPDTVCPLSHAHEALVELADPIEPAWAQSEMGTAVGDALALAAARLHSAEDAYKEQFGDDDNQSPDAAHAAFRIASKAIILLTDGEQTTGDLSPEDGAQIAAEFGVKIYAIGINDGSNGGFIDSPLGQIRLGSGGADPEAMDRIAQITGGKAWIVRDIASLADVYREIDALEKTEIHTTEYASYTELFAPFAAWALCLTAAGTALGTTVLRRTP